MYRHVPKLVAQNKTKNHCWAAALVSWLEATPGRPKKKLIELIDQYSDLAYDGISEGQFTDIVADDFKMDWDRATGFWDVAFYNEKLDLGHVILLYSSGIQSGHAVVVYGVGYRGGTPMISYMDPWYDNYRYQTLQWFNNRPKLAAWPT